MAVDLFQPPNNEPEFLERLHHFEGLVPHMYLDSECNVTIGKGLMLSRPEDALPPTKFGFKHREHSDQVVTEKDVRDDWDRLRALAKKIGTCKDLKATAKGVVDSTKLDADPDKLDKEFKTRFDNAKLEAAKFLPEWLHLESGVARGVPETWVAYAVLDMVFNMGPGKWPNPNGETEQEKTGTGIRQYGKMHQALLAKDYWLAGIQSGRTQPGPRRNDPIRQWLFCAEYAAYDIPAKQNWTPAERELAATIGAKKAEIAAQAAVTAHILARVYYELADRRVGNPAAWRQTIWAGLMSRALGEKLAFEWGQAHAEGLAGQEKEMNLWNYQMGWLIALSKPDMTLKEIVALALIVNLRGECRRLQGNRLVPTNLDGFLHPAAMQEV